jgi:hypothetical protein
VDLTLLTVRSDLAFHLFRINPPPPILAEFLIIAVSPSRSTSPCPRSRALQPRRAFLACTRVVPPRRAPAPAKLAAVASPHHRSSRSAAAYITTVVQRATAVEPTHVHQARTRCHFSERNPNPSHPNPFVEAFFVKFSTPRTSPSPQGDITTLD